MGDPQRREFLTGMLKGTTVGLLSLVPGSVFNRLATADAEKEKPDTMKEIIRRATKENLYTELNASTLPDEEKLAIAMIKEVPRSEVKATLQAIDGGTVAEGFACGFGCGGGCGFVCGLDCPYALQSAVGVIDRKGALRIRPNKSRVRDALHKALSM